MVFSTEVIVSAAGKSGEAPLLRECGWWSSDRYTGAW